MKSRWLLSFLVSLYAVSVCLGQERTYVTLNAGFASFTPSSNSLPYVSQVRGAVEVERGNNVVHRLVYDKEGSLIVGYDFLLEALPDQRLMITIRPPNSVAVDNLLRAARILTSPGNAPTFESSPRRYPEPQIMRDGDTVSVDLLENPRTGTKIFDVVQVASSWERLKALELPLGNLPVANLRREPVALQILGFSIQVNNQVVASVTGGCSGPVVWQYLPGKGGFFFSIKPQEGYPFRRIGTVRDNTISFTWGSDTYLWITRTQVLAGGGTSDLWVMHDLNFYPAVLKSAATAPHEPACAAASRMENFMPKR